MIGSVSCGRHAGARRVQGQLADRDAHAVGAEVAEPEDALAVGDDDEADVVLGPVAQDLGQLPGPVGRQVEAARPAQDLVELLARLADGRRVDDRHVAAPGPTSARGRRASRCGPAAPSSARTCRWRSAPGRAGGRRARPGGPRLSMPSGSSPTSPSASRSSRRERRRLVPARVAQQLPTPSPPERRVVHRRRPPPSPRGTVAGRAQRREQAAPAMRRPRRRMRRGRRGSRRPRPTARRGGRAPGPSSRPAPSR